MGGMIPRNGAGKLDDLTVLESLVFGLVHARRMANLAVLASNRV
jgi:hypothetical protein